MLELALHILDIAENSVRAEAKTVSIGVTEEIHRDRLTIEIVDDGVGMSPELLKKAMDPFYTSKKVRRVGMGLPMLAEAAQKAGGRFDIESTEGSGTRLAVVFQLSHIDRQPLGDVAGSLVTLIAGNPGVDFVYRHRCEGRVFLFDTREIKRETEGIPINHIEVLKWIRQYIREGLSELGTHA
jgi:anti-sigma regulatory factor (Ser/Thr protein kinase)